MSKLKGYMEVTSVLENSNYNYNQSELRDAARQAPIHTFGWPIGVSLETEEYKPKIMQDGIVAEIITSKDQWGGTYDYWYLKNNASFYLLQSLFEDSREDGFIYFDTRIIRVTESLLYLARLYYHLKIDLLTRIHITVEHGGLKGRHLKSAGRRPIFQRGQSSVEFARTEVNTTVGELESDLINLVGKVVGDLFVFFDYFKVNENVLEEIVTNFIKGEIS